MKPFPLYLLEVLFCSGLLLAFYRLLLVRKVSFAACRSYLVAAVLLSALIPALNIPLYPARTVVLPLPLIGVEEPVAVAVPAADPLVAPDALPETDWPRVLRVVAGTLCLAATALMLVLFVVRIAAIRRLRRRSRLTDCGDYRLAENPSVETPFSFLRTVFLGEGFEGRRREMVLCHEASHVRHRHSLERIVLEGMRCLMWFNPFVWIACRWLREVQEWEADRDVLGAGYDLTEYRIEIFAQLFGYNPDIASGLNHSFTKNRFVMMTQCKVHRFALARFGAAIPLVAGMLLLCSFTVREADSPAADKTTRPVATVTIRTVGDKPEIRLNDQVISPEELSEKIAAWREQLSEEERSRAEVTLRAEPDTRMQSVNAIKNQLRRANLLRVAYQSADDPAVMRMLPPDPEAVSRLNNSSQNVRIITDLATKVRERNVFFVRVTASGTIVAGQAYQEREVRPSALPELIETFVTNEADDPRMPEKEPTEIELPAGGAMRYPVSRGIVFLMTGPNTPYDAYVEAQRLVSQAYDRIRNRVAQRQFGRGFDELNDEQRQVIQRAVPIKVTEAEPVQE